MTTTSTSSLQTQTVSSDLNFQKAEKVENNCKADEKGAAEETCRIDVRNEEEGESDTSSGEEVCRICQLGSSEHHLATSAVTVGNINLVNLGCGCKGELGISHYHCAKTWFLQKGNRTCEICGKPAKNIEGIEDTGFRAFITSSSGDPIRLSSNEGEQRCGKSFCNFLLAAIIIAFLLPWLFHPGNRLL